MPLRLSTTVSGFTDGNFSVAITRKHHNGPKQSLEKLGINGGGGSRRRTRLCRAFFPVLRENTGKFVKFRLGTTIDDRLGNGNSIAYKPNSLIIGIRELVRLNQGKTSRLLGKARQEVNGDSGAD
jgi:hypothetical protein